MRSHGRDSGSIVLSWLTKLTVVLLLVGVVLFDSVSIGVARMSASDDANTAAQAAVSDWEQTHNVQSAYNAAVQAVNANHNETVLTRGFSIDPNGTVHLLLRRDATTLVLYRIGALKKYGVVTARGEAVPATQ